MSKISTYSLADTPLQLSDRLIGTEAPRPQPTATPLATKNFSLGELLQLFSQYFPADTLQAVLDAGNIATQDMFITGTIDVTLIKPTNIEDILGSQGTNFQFLSKATTGINWVNLPVDNLQAVLNAGNTATQNINLTGNITSTRIIPGNIQDYTTSIGTTGQVLTKSTSGIVWSNFPIASTPGLNDVLLVGNTSLQDANIGALGLWDNVNAGYMPISAVDNSFIFEDSTANKILAMEQAVFSFFKSNSIAANVNTISLTTSRNFSFPDQSGTLALVSDIPAAITLTTTGTSGAATLIAGVLNVPTYTLSGLGGVPTSRTLTINGTAYDLTTDRSWSVGTVTSVTATGQITSTGGTTPIISTLMHTDRLIGRTTAGTGVMEEIAVGSGLTLSAGTLSASGGGTVTSVGLSMPSAFNVANSPITSAGTLAVTGAGTVSQYVRGDGTLANFPNSTGGGASVNYYLNGSVSQGTFGGATYYQMSKTPILGAGTNFTRTNGAGNGYIASFITDAGDPSFLNIPGGNWNLEFYFQSSSSGGSPQFYGEIYKVSATNVFTLVASGSANPEGITNGTTVDQYFTSIPVPQTSLLITDRLAIRIYVITGGRTITLHTENGNLCEVLTTFTTGLTALNGLTQQVQYFAVGTSGTDFNISSATDTHTFNLPTASATNRGALSSADWTTFNNKQNAIGYTPLSSANNGLSLSGTIAQLGGTLLQSTIIDGGSSSAYNLTFTNGDFIVSNGAGIGGARGNIILSNNRSVYWGTSSGNYISADSTSGGTSYYAPPATGSHIFYSSMNFANYGSGTKTGTATYNLSVTSTGNIIETAIPPTIPTLTAGSVLFSNGTTIAQDNANFFWDDTNNRLGIGTSSPTTLLDVRGGFNVSDGTSTVRIVNSGGVGLIGTLTTHPLAIRTDNTERMRITEIGNVGIGTSTPSIKLQVETSVNGSDGIWARNANTGTSAYGFVVAASGVGTVGVRAHSAAHGAWPNTSMLHSATGFTGGLSIYQDGANPISLWTNATERMRITSTGNVGIGTTSPQVDLDVASKDAAGTVARIRLTNKDLSVIDEQDLSEIQFYNSDADGAHISAYIKNIAAETFGRKGQLAFGVSTTNSTNAVEALRIDENANIGIGTTSPTSRLTVLNTSSITTALFGGGVASPAWVSMGTANSGATPFIQGISNSLASNTNLILNPSGGNVGIGTVSPPTARLDVRAQGALSTDIAFRVRNSADTTNIISVNGNGLIGINTSTPGVTLDIIGQMRANGGIFTTSVQANVFQTSGLDFAFRGVGGTTRMTMFQTTGNLVLQNGGTFTDILSSKLTINSTTQGFLPPRMTNAERLAIASPAVGLMVYCTDVIEGLYINKSTGWTFII